MEAIFELIFQFLGELLVQLVAEALAEFGLRRLLKVFKGKWPPLVVAVGYALLGGIAGLISLPIAPKPLITGHGAQLAGLVVIPTLSGAAMRLFGRWRTQRGHALVGLDHFAYAFIFAFAMTVVRFRILG